jgi:hypothetical protein
MKKRKAKVLKARDCFMWYSDKVGQVIEIERETFDFYWSRDSGGYINIVYKDDVEIIEERNDNGT